MKNAHYIWIDECEHSFQELKKRLVTAPLLALPTKSSNFIVYSDAFKKGLGCVLMQNDNVITYALHQLRPYEQNCDVPHCMCMDYMMCLYGICSL
jgi:hypothetical protein